MRTSPVADGWVDRGVKYRGDLEGWKRRMKVALENTPVGHVYICNRFLDLGQEVGYERTRGGWGKAKIRFAKGYLDSLMSEATARGY